METISPEDIRIDNLSYKLNKGCSYIVDRCSVSFWPNGSNIYKSNSGNLVLKFSLNGEDNIWLDSQSVRIFFNLQNLRLEHLITSFVHYPRLMAFLEEC